MMKKQNTIYLGIGIVVIILIAAIAIFSAPKGEETTSTIKIGVITDLTGPAAYWGESTRVGAELAKQDLLNRGVNVNLVFEDYQLDTGKALTAAQKLVNVDNVKAIYAEFNPAAISAGSFLKDKNVLYIYDAAVTSPLEGNSNAYKTYLDYKEGCKQVANKFKEQGIENIGVLKVNLEFGKLCLDGVKEIYGSNTYVETYNLGDQDFKTQMLKLTQNDIGAVINVGFEGDTINTLKVIEEQNLNIKYGTVADTITEQVIEKYSNVLKGSISFGFIEVSSDFKKRISQEKISTNYGAALAYTHIMQIGEAFEKCDNALNCVKQEMNNAKSDDTIGFIQFKNHIAELKMQIIQR